MGRIGVAIGKYDQVGPICTHFRNQTNEFSSEIEISSQPPPKPLFLLLGTEKSLSIAKNHPKPSQEFSELFGPSIHKMKGFSRNSPQKVHPNFAQNLGRQILGNTFSGLSFLESTAVQMRGVLSSRLRGQEGPAIQMGGVLPYKLEVYCRTFFETSRGWGF